MRVWKPISKSRASARTSAFERPRSPPARCDLAQPGSDLGALGGGQRLDARRRLLDRWRPSEALEVVPPERCRPLEGSAGKEEGRGEACLTQRRCRRARMGFHVVVERDRNRERFTGPPLGRGVEDVARGDDPVRIGDVLELAPEDCLGDRPVEHRAAADPVIDEDNADRAGAALGEAPQDAGMNGRPHRCTRRP